MTDRYIENLTDRAAKAEADAKDAVTAMLADRRYSLSTELRNVAEQHVEFLFIGEIAAHAETVADESRPDFTAKDALDGLDRMARNKVSQGVRASGSSCDFTNVVARLEGEIWYQRWMDPDYFGGGERKSFVNAFGLDS